MHETSRSFNGFVDHSGSELLRQRVDALQIAQFVSDSFCMLETCAQAQQLNTSADEDADDEITLC